MLWGPGTLSYWWKVDSESGWDFLRFKMDGSEVQAISGFRNWMEVTHSVPAGNHTLSWTYDKDGSVSTGSDAAWLDLVYFSGSQPPALDTAPGQSDLFTSGELFLQQAVTVSNSGGGTLNYTANTSGGAWLSVSPSSGSSTGETDTLQVTANAAGLSEGNYSGSVTISGNGQNDVIPVSLSVTSSSAIPVSPQVARPISRRSRHPVCRREAMDGFSAVPMKAE